MADVGQNTLILIGCGAFGAAAVARLKARKSGTDDWRSFAIVLKANHRLPAAEQFQKECLNGWPALDSSLQQANAPCINIVAAADEADGSGILVAALRVLRERYGPWKPVVWLAMPAHTADQYAKCRVFATLLEVESLQSQWPFQCMLYEIPEDRPAAAEMFADAVVVHHQVGQRSPGYYGFGLGVVCDPKEEVRSRLVPVLERHLLERRLNRPEQGEKLAGLKDRLVRRFDALWAETDLTAQRWFSRTNPEYRSAIQDSDSPHYACGQIEAFLVVAERYYNGPTWARVANEFWSNLIYDIEKDAREELELEVSAGVAPIRLALHLAVQELQSVIQRKTQHLQARRDALKVSYEKARQELDAAARQRYERFTPDVREYLLRCLEEFDAGAARYSMELYRLVHLERLPAWVAAQTKNRLEELEKKADIYSKLLAAVEQSGMPSFAPEPPHVLMPPVTEEYIRSLIGEVSAKNVPVQTAESLQMGDRRRIFTDAVRREVELLLAGKGAPPHYSRKDPARQAWLSLVTGGLVLQASPEETPVARTCTASSKLPLDYQEDLKGQKYTLITQGSFPGWPSRWVVYAETGPFPLTALARLSQWGQAYMSLSSNKVMHTGPTPPEGWPKLVSGLKASAEALERAARTLVRCAALGLISPGRQGGYVARAVSPEGDALLVRQCNDIPELLETLAAEPGLQTALDERAECWLRRMEPEARAGYAALLQWLQPSRFHLEQQPGGQVILSILEKTLAAERTHARQSLVPDGREGTFLTLSGAKAKVIGTERDDLTVAVGEWRHLKW